MVLAVMALIMYIFDLFRVVDVCVKEVPGGRGACSDGRQTRGGGVNPLNHAACLTSESSASCSDN
jgi:hypothetical protein